MSKSKTVDSVKACDIKGKFGTKYFTDLKRLRTVLDYLCEKDYKIVLTMGTWDLLHIGHARYMAQAKNHGDILVVGVDSDRKVKVRKGPDRPIVPQGERMEMVGRLESVDVVVLKECDVPKWHMIKSVSPDILIATKETYSPEQIGKVEKLCGKVIVLDPQATTSTSEKVRHLQITTADKIEKSLRPKLINTIEEVFNEIKGK